MKKLLLILLTFALIISGGASVPADTADIAASAPVVVELRCELAPVSAVQLPVLIPELAPEPEIPAITIDTYSAELIAKTLYGEYRGENMLQQAAVVWCILNRCDYYGMSIEAVITQPNQYLGYDEDNPVLDELYDMACDILYRWEREKRGEADVGRVLPREYMWFHGDGRINHFRDAFNGSYTYWGWSLPNPYEEAAA